jgi:RNA polymerase sigma-70 factor, ECF subfamily
MGSLGLTLLSEHRIVPRERQGESRVDRTELQAGPKSPAEANLADEALATACQAGDLRAYERFYQLQGARMKNLARNLLGTQSDAEDAVQETFLKVQRSIGTFRGQSSFVTWAFRILVNTCYDVRRGRLRRKEIAPFYSADAPERPEPRAPGAHPSLRLALERALQKLTQHQREVFLLYEVEGFRHAEIAHMLEMSETASKNTLFQAKKNLRAMLEAPRNCETGGPR